MKKLKDTLYKIEEGLYAEQRADGKWVISDEKYEVHGGPFDTLEELEASRMDNGEDQGPAEPPPVAPAEPPYTPQDIADMTDLVTLREAAEHLPLTRQALEKRKSRGTLPVSPIITGRSVELYSLKALREAFPS